MGDGGGGVAQQTGQGSHGRIAEGGGGDVGHIVVDGDGDLPIVEQLQKGLGVRILHIGHVFGEGTLGEVIVQQDGAAGLVGPELVVLQGLQQIVHGNDLDLAGDGSEFLFGELLGEDELLALGGDQLGVLLAVIDDGKTLGVIDLAHLAQSLQLGIVHEGQSDDGNGSEDGADGDEGGALAVAAAAAVGDRAEDGQHDDGQDIIQSHDHAGPELGHAEFVGQDNGDGRVIGLPENTDQEEREADQDGALVIELHKVASV